MNSETNRLPPDAVLLLSPDCPHCATVLAGLTQLLKEGRISRIEIINVAVLPEYAEALGVRSVPWIRIGPFELDGAVSLAELRQWAERTRDESGMAAYFGKLLASGRRRKVEQLILESPQLARSLIRLAGDPQTGLHERLGIGAALEELRGTGAIRVDFVHALGELTRHPDIRVRADACHYLALTASPEAIPYARACIADPSEEVREIATETLETLEHGCR